VPEEGFPVAVKRGYFEVSDEKADDIFQRDAAAGNVSFVVERECLIGQYEAEMQVGDFYRRVRRFRLLVECQKLVPRLFVFDFVGVADSLDIVTRDFAVPDDAKVLGEIKEQAGVS
jgi:hypothetical protein